MATKSKHTKQKLYYWAGILLAQIVLFYLLSYSKWAVGFAQNFFLWKQPVHQALFAALPFSAGDLMYLILGIMLFFFVLKLIFKRQKARTLLQVFILINVGFFTYQIFWGMLYFTKPLSDGLPEKEPTLYESKMVAQMLLKKCIADRTLVREDRNGVFKVYDKNAINKEIDHRKHILPKEFSRNFPDAKTNVKPSLFSPVMSATGILGYYNPFTAEAQYNNRLPSSALPFTLAHETAHQLGYAREQEANFIGYLLAKNSKNLDLRYSSNLYALRSVLGAIYSADSVFVKSTVAQYSFGMLRDRHYEKAFAKRTQGPLNDFFGFTNDLFLKSNRQDGSITYSYFTGLLVRYEAKNVIK